MALLAIFFMALLFGQPWVAFLAGLGYLAAAASDYVANRSEG